MSMVTVDQYEEHLRANLQDLLARLHRGAYQPQPSLGCDIPKGDGKTRPLGIAAVEDKIVQRAVVMILERIYEVDFWRSRIANRDLVRRRLLLPFGRNSCRYTRLGDPGRSEPPRYVLRWLR
jgi:hypothetical protein